MNLFKYPKTQHILGSKECDVSLFPKKFQFKYPTLEDLKEEGDIIIEEKMDGMGIGLLYKNSIAHVQFRNHLFTQEDCPKNFKNIFTWIAQQTELPQLLKENKILFGEWMEHKHCVFYDALPSYFIEYDIFDLDKEVFWDTQSRKNILTQYNFNNYNKLTSAHVIHQNGLKSINELVHLLSIKTGFGKSSLCEKVFVKEFNHLKSETLYDPYPEGFYIKTEKDGIVIGRYKFIRKSFMDKVLNNKHWNNGSSIKNKLLSPI